ncbi:exopolyphosphatase [Parvibium lacunae]|uniref:Exopolyphosphatase n=1 Tax=Parvibium lacunae TaxID=1888893 RepID=A0A368L7E5_9BURK|nr:exopolyphosphatase [Parvibium lacunae]RCS59585.1 exopolyphosphatase [Parvibium lacunae]
MPNRNLLAAVDLGSNSFRLFIGRLEETANGIQIYPVDSLKEPVRLASGLDADKKLNPAAQLRAVHALQRFGERLRAFQPEQVRAVATNTFRVAKNMADFLPTAEAALGFPIEVIAGREEARLIYLGVAHSLPLLPIAQAQRLVIDIGGGSTEFIIGSNYEPRLTESLLMGCVSYTMRFFPEGALTKEAFKQAELAARKEVETLADNYMAAGWQEVIGSSGTAKALAEILELNQFNPPNTTGITRRGLEKLRDHLVRAGQLQLVRLEGLKADRMPVMPGGLAIMLGIFAELDLQNMDYAEGALRLGVLYDLLGRDQPHDMRELTVKQFMRRYAVDERHALAVAGMVDRLAAGLPMLTLYQRHLLHWAALLHEVGLSIAHASYHKHSAYVLANADMPGFAKREQQHLATLVLGHVGKLAKLTRGEISRADWHLVLLLRLGFLFCRRRSLDSLPEVSLEERAAKAGPGYLLRIDKQYLQRHPLTDFSLAQEASEWLKLGVQLQIKGI